ncbi:MAG: hypothetical protein GX069_04060 [Tissierellia bacterium]|nr:hypothetical protein [Tissierellia bacterium]
MDKNILEILDKSNPPLADRLKFLEELYWANWEEIGSDNLEKIFGYLTSRSLEVEEMAKVLSLYNNVAGAYTDKFANIIGNYYREDKIKFFKALNLNKDEAIYLVYIFKMLKIFEDGDKEYEEVKNLNKLTDEELDTANMFFTMYRTICHT